MHTTISISNLPLSVDASDLEDMFTVVGNVRSAQVLFGADSTVSLGRGVVQMTTREEAENGKLYFNGKIMEGRALMVRMEEPATTQLKTNTGYKRPYHQLRREMHRLVKSAK